MSLNEPLSLVNLIFQVFLSLNDGLSFSNSNRNLTFVLRECYTVKKKVYCPFVRQCNTYILYTLPSSKGNVLYEIKTQEIGFLNDSFKIRIQNIILFI